jgi:ArsR family transcriptional regulator
MKLVQIYRCFCDETRLRMLHLLTRGPLCVCHFQDILREPQCVHSNPVFRHDLKRLTQMRCECEWVESAVQAAGK